jgi:RsiW-degrading membrane proteinase PrsW (M82 family)
MLLIEIEWHPSVRQLRLFGLSSLVASAVLSLVLVFLWHVAPVWTIIPLTAGAGICLCSLLWRRAARVLYLTLTIAAMPIGIVVSLVLLGAFYFLLLTPVALFFRLIGRDSLHRSFDRDAQSYWVPHKPPADFERYFHQS